MDLLDSLYAQNTRSLVRHLTIVTLLAAAVLVAFPTAGQASCNLRPGTRSVFDGTQGSLNRPFAGPGESLEVSVRGCDDGPGLGASASDHNVTVLFKPPSGTPTAVVLSAAADCSAIAPQLSACESALGGAAFCVAGADADLKLVNRSGIDALSFRFPDTDSRCNGGTDAGTPCGSNGDCDSNDCSADIDGRTLSGSASIVVTDSGDALPCNLTDCASAVGTISCVDRLYAAAGTCDADNPGKTFSAFIALPSPNVYALECIDTEPPCNSLAGVEELRIGLDARGNMLVPFRWDGIREQLEGEPVARVVRATIAENFQLPGQSFVASFSPEGRRLDPVFEPKPGGTGSLTLFGSSDAPYTILRVASGSDSGQFCVGGANDTLPCNDDAECPDATCEPAICVGGADAGNACNNDSDCDGIGTCGTKLFDFSPLVVDSGQGPAVLGRDAGGGSGVCQGDVSISCSADCGANGPCVNYKLEASTTVPLDGLLARDEIQNFAVTERIDGNDLNNDGDTVDLVMTVRDPSTGDLIPLGAPAAGFCGIPADPGQPVFGRAVVRTASPPLLLPAGAANDSFLAFLEPEAGQNSCDMNIDNDTDDAFLRIFTTLGTQVAQGSEIPADEATVINDRSLVISDDKVWFRTSEPETADKFTARLSQNIDTPSTPANGASTDVEISPSGRWAVFLSTASNLISGETNGKLSVFRVTIDDGTILRASENFDGDDPNVNCFRPSINSAGKIAFDSLATNLDKFDLNPEDPIFDNDIDIFVGSALGNPARVSDTNAGTDPDGFSANASIGLLGTAFESTSTDLLGPGEDTNGDDDIYFKPINGSNNLIRLSKPTGGGQANGDSRNADMAEYVMVVAFDSNTTNFGPGDGITRDVYVYDDTGTSFFVERISTDINGNSANGVSDVPKISGDGRFVAFNSTASDLIVGDTNGDKDIFVHDRWFAKTRRVSVSTGGAQANGPSDLTSISADGRYVMFSSSASDLVSGDTNGNIDYFVHDLVARTTVRVNVNSSGGQVTGETTTFVSGGVADDNTTVVWKAGDSSYSGTDTNGVNDIYFRTPQSGDPGGADLTGDGITDQVVLRSFDLLSPPAITNIAPADAVKVAGGTALFTAEREQIGLVEGNDVQTFRYWDGTSITGVGFTPYIALDESDAMVMTVDVIAVIDDEASLYDWNVGVLETTDANGDGDSNDGYLVVRDNCSPIGSCSWSIPTGTGGQALMASALLQPLGANGSIVVMVADEAEHGASSLDLNGDGDKIDAVLHLYDAQSAGVTNLGLAAEDFVIGDRTNVAACGAEVHLIAFRVPESAQGNTNLNGAAFDPDFPQDTDTDDFVLHVHDLVSGTTINTGQSARPCVFADCDPRTPYRVNGSKVVFLTLEGDQGAGFGQDISGEGDTGDLVVQQYDFCNDITVPIERVTEGDLDPTDSVEESRVATTLAGRCDSGPCTPGLGDCDAGSYCEDDVCLGVLGLCSRHLSIACASDTDCARCIALYPGICLDDDECAGDETCLPQEVTTVASALDSDGDGINDDQDGCPDAFDPSGNDSDNDGIPDACDLQTCRPFPRGDCLQPGDGKASISLKDNAEDKKDKLSWKWGKGEGFTKTELGDPMAADTYELCLYNNGRLATGSIPPGGTCDKNDKKPCWKELTAGYKYKDSQLTPQGISGALFKAGDPGKAKAKVTGKGVSLDMPNLASINGQLVVQLVNNTTGLCLGSGFEEPFKKRTATQIKAKGGISILTTTTTTTLPPCPDADNDGFLDATCGGLDCYDSNPLANPAQTAYFTVHRGDGSFDYDCSGTEETTIGTAGCIPLGASFCLESNVPGFLSATACGNNNTLVIDCGPAPACAKITSGSAVKECH